MKIINPIDNKLDNTPDVWRPILASLALGLCFVSILYLSLSFIFFKTDFLAISLRGLLVGLFFVLIAGIKLK